MFTVDPRTRQADPDGEALEQIDEAIQQKMHELVGQKGIDELAQDYGVSLGGDEQPAYDSQGGRPNGSMAINDLGGIEDHPYDYEDLWAMGADAIDEMKGAMQGPHVEEMSAQIEEMAETIGTPGTRFWDGRLQVEHAHKYKPFRLRGRRGNPGFLEKIYREEPVIRDAVDSIVEIQMAADHFIKIPDKDKISGQQRRELEEWTDTVRKALNNLDDPGTWQHYVHNATHNTALYGFAPFEVTWRQMDDYWMPATLEERKPSTVYQWVLNDKKSQWLGTRFEPQEGGFYTLSHRGRRVRDRKVINPRVSATGLNLEGVAPGRTAAHWLKFKKLLAQIAAAAAQKHGVPITYIKVSEAALDLIQTVMGDGDDDRIEDVVNTLDHMDAIEAPVVGLPDGLEAELQSPNGPMPSFETLIRYCDEMIAKCFSNEGTLLGHDSVGSYALAEVKDDKFMRSAPAWHRVIMRPINTLIKKMAIRDLGRMRAYPKVQFHLNSLQDTSSLIQDIAELFAPNTSIPDWPEGVQQLIAKQMGVEEDVFEQAIAEAQRRRQSATTPDSVGAPNDGEMPDASATTESMAETPDVEADGWEEMAEDAFDAETASREIDEAEDEVAERLYDLVQQQREAFEARTSDAISSNAIITATEEVSDEFRPLFEDVLVDGINELIQRGMGSVLRELGIEVPTVLEAQAVDAGEFQTPDGMPPLSERHRQRLATLATQLRDDLTDRNARRMRNQRAEQMDQPPEDRDDLSPLALSTVAGLASQLGGPAFNVGRDTMRRAGQEQMEQSQSRTVEIEAVRSTRMDSNVCGPCHNLDFRRGGPTYEAGSSQYHAEFPPNPCLGGDLCRCVIIYRYPQGFEDALRQVIGATVPVQGSSPEVTIQNPSQ